MKLILLLSLQMLIFYACEYPSGTRDDQIPPSIVITSPQNDTTVAGIVEIKCEVHDNMGIKRIGLIVDGSQTDEYKHRSPCVFNWNTMNYEKNSYHTIYALAVDLNDNSTISDSIRLKVDNSNLHISDYVEPINLSYHQFKYMIKRRGCNLNLSFGAFDDDELIGFTLNGIGEWNGL